MPDLITTYNLTGNQELVFPMDRKEFYEEHIKEFKKGKKQTKAVGVISVLLFNAHGEMFVQKRSETKGHNAGLLDKSIGGHIQFGDTPQYTAMIETVQELQVPSVTLQTDSEFQRTYKVLSTHLETVSVLVHVDSRIRPFKRIVKKKPVTMTNKYHLYFGIYHGPIKTVDRESSGALLYSLENIKRELRTYPNLFTSDLQFYVKEYGKQIEKFIAFIKKNNKK